MAPEPPSIAPSGLAIYVTDFNHYDAPLKYLLTPLNGTPQKCFQSGPAHARAGLGRVCVFYNLGDAQGRR